MHKKQYKQNTRSHTIFSCNPEANLANSHTVDHHRKKFPSIFLKLKKLTNQNIVASYEAGKNLDCTPTKLLLMTKIHHAAPSQIFDHS